MIELTKMGFECTSCNRRWHSRYQAQQHTCLKVGDEVTRSGYKGVVKSEYLPDMFEVKLASGTVVVPSCELKKL